MSLVSLSVVYFVFRRISFTSTFIVDVVIGIMEKTTCRKPCPSFKVAPTNLSQSAEQTSKVRTVAVTYLQFQIQVCILADRAYVLPRNVSAWPKMFHLWMGSEEHAPEADNTFVRIGYFGPVFRCTHDYTQCLKKVFTFKLYVASSDLNR